MVTKKPIASFRDLEVFQNTYQAMLVVVQKDMLNVTKSWDSKNI
jgi:hypothetical protein